MAFPSSIRNYLDQVAPLPEAFLTQLEALVTRRELSPRDHWSPLGLVQKTVGILESGVIRAYYSTSHGKEYNGHLYFAPAFVGDYTSIITGQPVITPQQALVPCVVWSFPFQAIVDLEDQFPEICRFRRIFAETMYLLKEQRELEIVTLNAGQRYQKLKRRVPDIDNMLPQYEIAAYLGITPSQLSRIRHSS